MIDVEEFNKMKPEEQKQILDKRVAIKKVRCKNWPGCKDPNCIFTHPTETVSLLYIFILIYIYLVSLFPCVYLWR